MGLSVSFFTGMIKNATDSLFTYPPYNNLSSFSDPNYRPLFDHEPSDNVIQSCGGDLFCAFDSTVTGDMAIGQATLSVVMEESRVIGLATPGEQWQ